MMKLNKALFISYIVALSSFLLTGCLPFMNMNPGMGFPSAGLSDRSSDDRLTSDSLDEGLGSDDVAGLMATVSESSTLAASSLNDVCENCTAIAGEAELERACKAASQKGIFEGKATTRSLDDTEFIHFLQWRSQALISSEQQCQNSCDGASGTRQYCETIDHCRNDCARSQIVGAGCRKNGRNYDRQCAKTCSGFPQTTSKEQRVKAVRAAAQRAIADMKASGKWNSLLSKHPNLDKIFVCLNLKRENGDLEPIERTNMNSCSYTAFGIGQVVEGTFFNHFGLNKRNTSCRTGKTVNQLAQGECSSVRGDNLRYELFKGYGKMTPQQIYDASSFDVDIQVRSMMGAWLNHYKDAGYNWKRAWRDYFGVKDDSALRRIESCAK